MGTKTWGRFGKTGEKDMAFIKGINRNQAQMFPEYLEDYVDEENPVRVIDAFVICFSIF